MVPKANAQIRSNPNEAPEDAAVVTVPGPMNAAETTDQKRILAIRDLN
jgi:hypothetical protein